MSKPTLPFTMYEIPQTNHVIFELESNKNISDAVPMFLHMEICQRLKIRNFDELSAAMKEYTNEVLKCSQYVKFEEIV
jgi:hypothetical protein